MNPPITSHISVNSVEKLQLLKVSINFTKANFNLSKQREKMKDGTFLSSIDIFVSGVPGLVTEKGGKFIYYIYKTAMNRLKRCILKKN